MAAWKRPEQSEGWRVRRSPILANPSILSKNSAAAFCVVRRVSAPSARRGDEMRVGVGHSINVRKKNEK
jgi:hypothetical protein